MTIATHSDNQLRGKSYGAPSPEEKHNTAAVCLENAARPVALELALPKNEEFLRKVTLHLTVEPAKKRPHHASTAMPDRDEATILSQDKFGRSDYETLLQAPGTS